MDMRSVKLMGRAGIQRSDKTRLRQLCSVANGGLWGMEGIDSSKRQMEARRMVCKGMVGVAWDEMLRGWGMSNGAVVKLRRELLRVCLRGVSNIWIGFCRVVNKLRVRRALGENADMQETINAAVEAHKFQLWKQGKTWRGERKFREKDPAAQIR